MEAADRLDEGEEYTTTSATDGASQIRHKQKIPATAQTRLWDYFIEDADEELRE
jgi:hypothetical protein